ncbi:glycosyltransferase family 4 protein [bacterium]|nr:glycosyltransferase family 4 protein [bacterium]
MRELACFAFIGPRTNYSRNVFRKYRDPRIIEKDRVSEEEKRAALADCAIFCLPSQQESFGGVYLKVWMMKKPVIGGNIPAVSELITTGQDGEVVDQKPRALAEKINQLLKNPDLMKNRGENGYQKLMQKFNWESIAVHQKKVYQQLLGD